MKRSTKVCYALAWVAYMAFSLAMFPRWNAYASMPVIGLIAVGAWLFGRTVGLVLIMPMVAYHYLLYSEIHGDIMDHHGAPFCGTAMLIVIVFSTATLKETLYALRQSNERLNALVAQRNAELAELSGKLVEQTEKMRNELGEALHDGIGQQLTGIQMFCALLADRLHAERDPCVALAHSLKTRVAEVNRVVRTISRALFPVRIGQTGLAPALGELVACMRDLHRASLSLALPDEALDLPEASALHIYRICQECLLQLAVGCAAGRIEAKVGVSGKHCCLLIGHDGAAFERHADPGSYDLVKYRLQQVSGTLLLREDKEREMQWLVFAFPGHGEPART